MTGDGNCPTARRSAPLEPSKMMPSGWSSLRVRSVLAGTGAPFSRRSCPWASTITMPCVRMMLPGRWRNRVTANAASNSTVMARPARSRASWRCSRLQSSALMSMFPAMCGVALGDGRSLQPFVPGRHAIDLQQPGFVNASPHVSTDAELAATGKILLKRRHKLRWRKLHVGG